MKTVELKLNLNKSQQSRIDDLLKTLTWVWNNGLALLEWREYWLRCQEINYYPTELKNTQCIPLPQSILDKWGFVSPEACPVFKLDWKFNQIECFHVTKKGKKELKKSDVFGLCSPCTLVKKISLNDYPEIKEEAKYLTVEQFDNSTIYSGLRKLTLGQFIEKRESKKGISFYLHTPGIPENKPHWKGEPPIRGFSDTDLIDYFGKKKLANYSTIPDGVKVGIADLDSKFIAGQCQNLANAWKQYKGKKRGKPRFKKYTRSEMTATIIHNNAGIRERIPDEEKVKEKESKQLREEAKAGGIKKEDLPPVYIPPKMPVIDSTLKVDSTRNRIRLPLIGWVKVKGKSTQLLDRWGNAFAVSYRICKEASGYYIKLTEEINSKPKISLTRQEGNLKAIGIDVGVACLYADDAGRLAEARKYKIKIERKIARFQRQAANKKLGSKNWEKLQLKISKLHEKDRRRSIAADHKITTKLIREYDGIAVESLNLANMTAATKTKLDGKEYAKNGRKRKSALNKGILRNSPGRRNDMLEKKVKAINEYFGYTVREFVKVDPKNTSKKCNECGHIDTENRKTQKDFKCVKCGHIDHADVNAAKNIFDRGLLDFERSYRTWRREVKPVSVGDGPTGEIETLRSSSMRQEAATTAVSVVESAELTAEYSAELTAEYYAAQPTPKGGKPPRQKKKECAKRRVSKSSSDQKQPQTLTPNSFEGNTQSKTILAIDENPVLPGLEAFFDAPATKKKSNSRKKENGFTNSIPETYFQPILWDKTDEINF